MNNKIQKIKVHCATTTGELQEWISTQDGIVYDSIKLQCHSVDNSGSGVIFTIIAKVIDPS